MPRRQFFQTKFLSKQKPHLSIMFGSIDGAFCVTTLALAKLVLSIAFWDFLKEEINVEKYYVQIVTNKLIFFFELVEIGAPMMLQIARILCQ